MSQNIKKHYDPEKTLAVTKDYFAAQVALLDDFTAMVAESNMGSARLTNIAPLLIGVVTAGKGVLALTDARLATEIFVLSRCVLERCVNSLYLMLCDEKEFRAYFDYAIQKGYRATSAKKKTAHLLGLKYRITPPSESLSKLLNIFPKAKWTATTFKDRLLFIQKEAKELLSDYQIAFYCNIYEDSSESVHGSLYGVMFHIGSYSEMCPAGALNFLTHYVARVLMNLGSLIDVIFKRLVQQSPSLAKFSERSAMNEKAMDTYFEGIRNNT